MTATVRIIERRKERRSVPPFGDGKHPNRVSNLLDRVLAPCQFAPFPRSGFLKDEPYFLSVEDEYLDASPRFHFELDQVDELLAALGAQPKDLKLSLSVRSRHLMRYEVLGDWHLSSIPTNWSPNSNQLQPLQSHRDMTFILAMRVNSEKPELKDNGLDFGKVLCRKEFHIRERTIATNFPFEWVEFGGETGFPEEMLWVVRWKVDEEDENPYDHPVNEILTVWVNSKANAPLLKMDAVSGSRNLAWKMLAADITTEIWWQVIANIQETPSEDERDTLAGQVFGRLAQAGGRSYEEIHDFRRDQDGRVEIRKLISSILKVVN